MTAKYQTTRTFTSRFILKPVSGGYEIQDPAGTYQSRWCASKKDAYRVIESRLAHERLVAQRTAREARETSRDANTQNAEGGDRDGDAR